MNAHEGPAGRYPVGGPYPAEDHATATVDPLSDLLSRAWADPMWRECFRLSRNIKPRGVPGFTAAPADFDPFRLAAAFALTSGEMFDDDAPWLGVFLDSEPHALVLVSARADITIGNGNDRWDEEGARIDVQYAATLDDLVRLAMTNEDRARLFPTAVSEPLRKALVA